MKKLLCFLLAAVMLLGLCACDDSGKEGDAAVKGLQVGFGREKIHPETPVPLGGYGQSQNRISTGFLDYLMATCIAFREGENTYLLIAADVFTAEHTVFTSIREEIAEATGVDMSYIVVSASHTHSAPDIYSADDTIKDYKELMKNQMIKAAQAALEDLAPAELYAGMIQVEGMNFVRHYLMNNDTYSGSNFGSTASGYKGYAEENDPDMGLVKITREGDKDDILLMNWAAHPCFTGGTAETNLSADYIGVVRSSIEAQTKMKFAFFQAAAGNQNTDSNIQADRHNMDNNSYGQKLAEHAINALDGLKKVEGSGVEPVCVEFTYNVNHEDEEKIEEAREVVDMWSSAGRDAGNILAYSKGFGSVYHAENVLTRKSRPAQSTMKLYAARVGNMVFLNAPYEMFSSNARYIKANSPYEMTFITTLSNAHNSYFATREAFAFQSYESQISYYARGVAEDTADKWVEIMNDLKN